MLRNATRGLHLGDSADQSAVPSNDESSMAQWMELVPEPGTYERLSTVAKDYSSSLFGVVYTAIALALYSLGNLKDLAIGTSASGRTDPEFFDTVGYFTTMVSHRVQFLAHQSVGELIREVTRTINDSMPYADIPIDIVQNELGMTPEDGLLFDVYIQIHANNALNGTLLGPDGAGIRYRQMLPDKGESLFGLHFEIMEDVFDGKRDLRIVVTYRRSRYSPSLVRAIFEEIRRVFALFDTAGVADRRLEAFFDPIAIARQIEESSD
jgi:non-ribosomal peptide synthetase component F